MKSSALNLLPWRERQSTKKIINDFLFWIFLLGMISLFLEITLCFFHLYESHYQNKKNKLDKVFSLNARQFEQAQQEQKKLIQLQQLIKNEKNNQQFWKNKINTLQDFYTKKPGHIIFQKIFWENNTWLIDGFAETSDDLTQYQKNLQAKNKVTEINRWSAKVLSENDSNFQLSLTDAVDALPT
jgi:hypothetical protein